MTVTGKREEAQGLICPNCSGVVPVTEGSRIVQCPFCGTHSLVQGDRGIQRWQIRRQVDRDGATAALDKFLTGARKARDLRREARLSEVILAYLPFWRVDSTVAGWLFGRVSSGDDDTKPAEFFIFERMSWNDAALEVGDLAIERITVNRADLQPFNSQELHAEAMVFDPTESPTEAVDEARRYFEYEAERKAHQKTTYYRNVQVLNPQLTLAYYPVWIVRYTYRQRTYQVVIDGVSAKVVVGNAPGSTIYRAATLVSALAAGTFIFVNGSILVLASGLSDDDGFGIVLLPIVIGLLLILWGYRNFRFGEEVEDHRKEYRKARPSTGQGLLGSVLGEEGWKQLRESGKSALEEIAEAQQKRGDDE